MPNNFITILAREDNIQEDTIAQAEECSELPTPKQFRATFKEIFESETTFGSAKAAREVLLENVQDIIKEYLAKGSRIVYLHGKLKEAGYTGSRKELSEWLVAKGLWTKREIAEKKEDIVEESESVNAKNENPQEKIYDEEVHPGSFRSLHRYELQSLFTLLTKYFNGLHDV